MTLLIKVMYDHEKSTPLELGPGWTVKPEKDYFVGQSALLEDKKKGLIWNTIGLEIDLKSLEAIYAKYGMPLYLPYQSWSDAVLVSSQGKQIGKATSGTWSPMLKIYRHCPNKTRIFQDMEPGGDGSTVDAERNNT